MNFAQTLKETYPYITELHCHSSGVSACASISPEQLVRLYAGAGFSGIVFTNHMLFEGIKNEKKLKLEAERHIKEYEKGKKEGERVGINVMFAAELRFAGDDNDFLFYGPDPEFYLNLDYRKTLRLSDFAEAYRSEDNLLLQAHPFRTGMTLAPLEYIDGVEVYNLNIRHNSRVGIAAQYAEENGLISVCGSDFHHMGDGQFCGVCTRERPTDIKGIVRAIKENDVCWKLGASTIVF